jgi:hypothetical protein
MIRFLFRFVGLLCLAFSFIFFVHDGTKWIANQTWFVTRVSTVWGFIHEGSLAQAQPFVERVAPWLWDPVARPFLDAPAWIVLLVLGAILILLGRKKKRLIGYARD